MGFWAGICSIASAASSCIGGFVSTFGKSIVGLAQSFIKELSPIINAVMEIIKIVAENVGVLKPEDDIEELGAKAMKSDKKVEDFDSIKEYIDHLRNDTQLEKEDIKKMSESERLASKAVGSTLVSKSLSEKIGIDIPVDFWGAVVKHSMNFKEITSIIEAYKINGAPLEFSDYLKGKMNFIDRDKNQSIIVNAFKTINPELSDEEIEDKIMNLISK